MESFCLFQGGITSRGCTEWSPPSNTVHSYTKLLPVQDEERDISKQGTSAIHCSGAEQKGGCLLSIFRLYFKDIIN